jgi:hypothetical protein
MTLHKGVVVRMHHNRRLAAACCVAVLLGLVLSPGAASAAPIDDYYQQVAQGFKSHHVYVDPQAQNAPSSSQVQTLEKQIDQSGKPIYIAFVDSVKANQAKKPVEVLDGIHAALGAKTTAFIAFGTAKGFYATGYNMKSGAIQQSASSATQATRRSSSPYTVASTWSADVAALQYQDSHTTRNIILFSVLLLALIIAACILFARRRSAHSREFALRQRAEIVNSFYNDNESKIDSHPEVDSLFRQMLTYHDTALYCLDNGEDETAEANLERAEHNRDLVDAVINPTAAATRLSYTPASSTRTSDYDGRSTRPAPRPTQRSEPASSDYTVYQHRRRRSHDYPHYSAGGMAPNGMYVQSGWYPAAAYSDPFLTGMLVGEMLDDDHDHGDRDYDGGGHDDNSGGGNYGNNDSVDSDQTVSSGDVGGGSYDGGSDNSDNSFGGGSYGSTTQDDSSSGGGSYDSGSSSSDYSSGGDYGGGSYGGGSDYSSGGGSDFSSGGGDYGGGGDSGGGF